MKLITLSDTHGHHGEITPDIYKLLTDHPDIDLIIHAGDGSNSKDLALNSGQLHEFLEWYQSLPIKVKIFTGGNHDMSLEAGLIDKKQYPGVTFLLHDSVRLEDGVRIFGSPYTPRFHDWAYNVDRDRLHRYWEIVPEDTDILVTHGPPKYILDTSRGESHGDLSLFKHVTKRIKPKLHIFGHFHDEDGHINSGERKLNGLHTRFINACIVNLRHQVVNSPILVEI